MFKGKKFVLLIFLYYMSVSVTNGQAFNKGIIFSNKGDTANGLVSLPAGYLPTYTCFFKPSADDDPIVLGANEIEGFQSAGQTFISTRTRLNKTDTILFIRRICRGVKEFRYYELKKVKHFIIVNHDSTIYEFQYPPDLKPSEVLAGMTAGMKFRQQADSIFPDAPDLPEYEKGITPEIISILNLFSQYHNPPYMKMTGSTSKTTLPKEFSKGLIITTAKDTIDGFLSNTLEKTFYRSCIFTPDLFENTTKFLPDEIAGFGNKRENKFFVPVKLPGALKDTSLFVRLLFVGTVDLLHYNSGGKDHFLLRDREEAIHQLSYPPIMKKTDYVAGLNQAGKFRKQADSIFSLLSLPVKIDRPDVKSMIRSFEDYHKSLSLPFNNYHGINRNVDLGITAGAKFEQYFAGVRNDGYKSYSGPAPYLGLYLTIINKTGLLGLLMRNTVEYHNDSYSYTQHLNFYSFFNQTNVKSLANNLEAGIFYRPFKKAALKPFIEAGGAIRYYFYTDYQNYSEEVYPENFIYSSHNHDALNSSFFFGSFARVGLTKAIKPKNSVSLSAGYSYLMSTGNERIHSAELSLIYNFLRK